MAETVTEQVKVSGMDCDQCAASIDALVGSLPGVFECKTELHKGTTSVTYDMSALSLDRIHDEIRAAGFEPRPSAP